MDATTHNLRSGLAGTIHIVISRILTALLGRRVGLVNGLVGIAQSTGSRTRTVVIIKIRKSHVTYIGTRVLVVFAVQVEVVLTVTTAEDLAYLVSCIHSDIGARRGSRIATAIDLIDAGQVATVDANL